MDRSNSVVCSFLLLIFPIISICAQDVRMIGGFMKVKSELKIKDPADLLLFSPHELKSSIFLLTQKPDGESQLLYLKLTDWKEIERVDETSADSVRLDEKCLSLTGVSLVDPKRESDVIYLVASLHCTSTTPVYVTRSNGTLRLLVKLTAPSADVIVWKNDMLNATYLFVISMSNTGRLYEISLDGQLIFISSVSLYQPGNLVHILIEDQHFIVVSQYKDENGLDVSSRIYLQDNSNGKLDKFQQLPVSKATAITHFILERNQVEEHFLIATSRSINDEERHLEENVIYKYENDSFIPFQHLYSPPSTKFIPIKADEMYLLVGWNPSDGFLMAYQYNGWTFVPVLHYGTDITVKNIEYSKTVQNLKKLPLPSRHALALIDINDKQSIVLFYPAFNGTNTAHSTYQDDSSWCESANLEIKMVKDKLENYTELFNYIPGKSYSDEEIIKAMFFQNYGFSNVVMKNKLKSDSLIMDLSERIENQVPFSSQFRSENPEEIIRKKQCAVHKEADIDDVIDVVATEDGLLARTISQEVIFISPQSSSFVETNRTSLYRQIDNSMALIHFSYVNLCSSVGLYVEGLRGDKVFGQVYAFTPKKELKLHAKLNISERSSVTGLCTKEGNQCYIVSTRISAKNCFLQCGLTTLNVNCSALSNVDLIKWESYSFVSLSSDKGIDVSHVSWRGHSLRSPRNRNSPLVDTAALNDTYYFVVSDQKDTQLCRKEDESKGKTVCKSINSPIEAATSIHLMQFGKELGTYMANGTHYALYFNVNSAFTLDNPVPTFTKFIPFAIDGNYFIALCRENSTEILRVSCS